MNMTAGSAPSEDWLGAAGSWDANTAEYNGLAVAAAERAGLPLWMTVRKKDVVMCKFFTACTHEAEGTVNHPLLGPVPTCQRCADVVAVEITPFPAEEGNGVL